MGLENGDESATPPQDLLERFKDYDQDQTLAYWHDLSRQERDILVNDLELVDLPRVSRIIRKSLRKQDKPNAEPILDSEVATLETRTQEERGRWWGLGLRAISEGKLAVLLLSGGQGTRLGSKEPKGCFNIGLPSGKSLFQLQAERILRVQKLASQSTANGRVVKVPWYIMTSPFTDAATKKFFHSRKFFGLEQDQVTFFQQGTLPCITRDGKFIMSNPFTISMAPDGNGGVYSALKSSKCLEDMTRRGVRYVDVYSVDNTLVRVADPLFLGYWIEQGTACAAKVIKKAYPQERVGVFVHYGKGGPVGVMEYTELGTDLQFAINQETGRLAYKWSNICMHMFSLDFLNTVVEELEKDSIYHLAEKKIPSVDGVIDGVKLEQFIFDSLPYAPSISLFEVIREEEFAPVKNASGATTDSPDTARALLQRLHMGWVVSAGGGIANTGTAYSSGLEVSPLLSYAGEGLEDLCRGRTFHASAEIHP